ncbi:TetR/AcrR family transcriptional regulator [Streptomyces sp. NPDC047072]|uniref:TetR/AcrR family transcriptional regulator n=1 Tax=Streptomyces sp. NPDC047072 TaxID=3154809 RepID=UPI0033C4E867
MPKISAANLAEHRDRTMTRLLDAFEAVVEEDGFADLTLAGVAERAGVARNTVYNYAKDKDALLVAVVERAIRGVIADLDARTRPYASTEDELRAVIDRLLAGFAGGALRLLTLQGLQGGPSRVDTALPSAERLRARIEDVVRRGIDNGEFRPVDDVALTVAMMAGVLSAAVQVLGRSDRTLAHVSREAKTVILRALRA